jgi:hypothetical protein
MDKVQKHNSFNTNTPSSESYRNYQGQECVELYLHFPSTSSWRLPSPIYLFIYLLLFDFREIGIDGANFLAGSGCGPVAGFCEPGDEPSGSIKK